MRRKVDRQSFETMAEEGSFVLAMKKELLGLMPIDEKLVDDHWVGKYIEADPTVMVEIQSAMLSKTVGGPRDIATMDKLMNLHANSCPIPESRQQVALQKLEEDSFNLVMQQIEYDIQALRVARSKRASFESSIYHAKLQHRVRCYEDSMKATEWFLVHNSRVLFANSGKHVLQQFQAFVASNIQKLRLDESAVATWPETDTNTDNACFTNSSKIAIQRGLKKCHKNYLTGCVFFDCGLLVTSEVIYWPTHQNAIS